MSRSLVSWDRGGLLSSVTTSAQPQAPWGSGSHLSRSTGQFSRIPGAAKLAQRAASAVPRSHETCPRKVRARVVQRAVTLWRLPPPSGARRVAAVSPSGLGVWRERPPQLPPVETWDAGRRSGSGAGTSSVRLGQCLVLLFGGNQVPCGNVAASPEGRDCFSFQRCLLLSTHSVIRERIISGFRISILAGNKRRVYFLLAANTA